MLEVGKEYQTKAGNFILILGKKSYARDAYIFVGETRNGFLVCYNMAGEAKGFKDECNYDLQLETFVYAPITKDKRIGITYHPLKTFSRTACISDGVSGFLVKSNLRPDPTYKPLNEVLPV